MRSKFGKASYAVQILVSQALEKIKSKIFYLLASVTTITI